MAQYANKSFTSNGNDVRRDQADSNNFMVHDSDKPAGDDSTLQIPDDLFTSEAFNQHTGDDDDEPVEEAVSAAGSEVELGENHLEKNFEYEMDPHSDSDFDHELYDDDGLPLVDGDNSSLLPWQNGGTYTESQYNYLSSFVSAYR